MTYSAAAGEALASAMRADARVVALGEDLGRGGVFGQYRCRDAGGTLRPLQQEFGAGRVIDTPISEANIMGAAVGKDGIPEEWLSTIVEWPRTTEWIERVGRECAEQGTRQP